MKNSRSAAGCTQNNELKDKTGCNVKNLLRKLQFVTLSHLFSSFSVGFISRTEQATQKLKHIDINLSNQGNPRFSLVERFGLDGHWSSWGGFQELPMTRPDDPVADNDFVFSLLLSLNVCRHRATTTKFS